MNDLLAHELNPLLNAFLATNEESDLERLLIELIDGRIGPIARKIIQGKLRASLQPTDERQINQDAWDLVSEVKTRVFAKLSCLKIDASTGAIESLEAYVKTVSVNACNQYLRKKYPKRPGGLRWRRKGRCRGVQAVERDLVYRRVDGGDHSELVWAERRSADAGGFYLLETNAEARTE